MNGISGSAFLACLQEHPEQFGVTIMKAEALSIARPIGELFAVRTADGTVVGGKILFATGIVDKEPILNGLEAAVADGLVRYCPVCDGYKAIGQSIGVLGPFDGAFKKALFLRAYRADVAVWCTEAGRGQDKLAQEAGIRLASEMPVKEIRIRNDVVQARFSDDAAADVGVLYPALGCHVRSELARDLRAACTDTGLLRVDEQQRTSCGAAMRVAS